MIEIESTAQDYRNEAARLLSLSVALDRASGALTMDQVLRGKPAKRDIFAAYREQTPAGVPPIEGAK